MKFNQLIFNNDFVEYELKQRMHHTAEVLHHFMSVDFSIAIDELKNIIQELRKQGIKEQSIEYMCLPLGRSQSFKVISTRVFHLGIHKLAIIINGQECGGGSGQEVLHSFELIDS